MQKLFLDLLTSFKAFKINCENFDFVQFLSFFFFIVTKSSTTLCSAYTHTLHIKWLLCHCRSSFPGLKLLHTSYDWQTDIQAMTGELTYKLWLANCDPKHPSKFLSDMPFCVYMSFNHRRSGAIIEHVIQPVLWACMLNSMWTYCTNSLCAVTQQNELGM